MRAIEQNLVSSSIKMDGLVRKPIFWGGQSNTHPQYSATKKKARKLCQKSPFFSRGCEEITGRRHHDFLVWLKILLGWSDIGKDSCKPGPTNVRSEVRVRGGRSSSSLTPIFMHLPAGMPADDGVGRDGGDGAADTAGARQPPKKKAKVPGDPFTRAGYGGARVH